MTTVMPPRQRGPEPIAHDVDERLRAGTGLDDLLFTKAMSSDQVWLFERDDIAEDKPWRVTYMPTGQQAWHFTLRGAWEWTQDPRTPQWLHQQAELDAARRGLAYRDRMQARRALAVWDGVLLPYGTAMTTASACECGGLLVQQAGKWRHVDGCLDCWTPDAEWEITCADERDNHRFCHRPEAAQCGHNQCIKANDLHAPGPCERGHLHCCGGHEGYGDN